VRLKPLQHPDEPLGAAIGLRPTPRSDVGKADRALGLPPEGRRARDAEEADLALEVVADVLRAVIVTQGEAAGDALGERAEALAHSLPDRLERSAWKRSARRLAWIPAHSAEPSAGSACRPGGTGHRRCR
jgi:hypothetical protein